MSLRRSPDYNFTLQSFPTNADDGTIIDIIDLNNMDVSSDDDNTDEMVLAFVSSQATGKYYSGLWWIQSSPVRGVNFTLEAKAYNDYVVPSSNLSTTGEKKGTRNKALSVNWENSHNKSEFVYIQANAIKDDTIGAFNPNLDLKYNSFLKVLYYENDYSIRHDLLHGEQSRYTQLVAQDLLIVKNGYEVSLGHIEGSISFNFDESQIEAKVGFPKATVLTAIEERTMTFSGQLQNVDPYVISLLFDENIQFTNSGTKLKVTNNVGEKKVHEIIIRGINKAKEIVEWRFPKCQLSIDGAIDLGKKQSYLGFKANILIDEESGDNMMAEVFWAPAKSILLTYPIKYSLQQ